MIQTSEAFHQAILDGKPQRVLITFPTCFFTNDDISVSGLKYSEMVNPDEDLTVGSATSSEISFSILNDNGLLNNFGFGQFDADLGVLIDSQPYSQYGNVTAQYGNSILTGHNDVPYLRINGEAVNVQPSFPVKSILIVDNVIYCLGENRKAFSLKKGGKWEDTKNNYWDIVLEGTWRDLLSSFSGQYVETSEFMYEKFSRYVVKRVGITRNDQIEIEYTSDGVKQTYEYARLGRFIAQRPSRVKTRVVGIEGNDFMTKFDTVLDGISLSFPMTISSLLEKICLYCGVELKTSSFINSGRIVKEYPPELYDATGREAIKWIAELACGFARVDREGCLEIVWFFDTNLSINESNYSSFVPSEYIVKPIDKVQIKSTADDVGAIIGDGVNAYVIQSNPLAIIESEADGIALTQPIYNRLSNFPAINPSAANWFGDWSYQAGDVITVSQGKDSYYLPIYTLSLSWNGSPKVFVESTGNESREPLDILARERYASKKSFFEIKKTVDGVSSLVSKKADSEIVYPEGTENVTTLESLVKQTATEVSTKVSSKIVDPKTGETYDVASTVIQTANDIVNKVNNEVVDSETGTKYNVESTVIQTAKEITSKVDNEVVDPMTGKKYDIASTVIQTAKDIASKVDGTLVDPDTGIQYDAATAIIQSATEWKAEFNQIGLAGKQTGITKINKDGVEVTHDRVGGKTSMNADGFRLYDANGNVIGGLMSDGENVVSAVQQLMNMLDTTFRVRVSPNIYGDGENGIEFIINGQNCGAITAHLIDGEMGVNIRSNGGIVFTGADFGVNLKNAYAKGRNVHYTVSPTPEPKGEDGDIWLLKANPDD